MYLKKQSKIDQICPYLPCQHTRVLKALLKAGKGQEINRKRYLFSKVAKSKDTAIGNIVRQA